MKLFISLIPALILMTSCLKKQTEAPPQEMPPTEVHILEVQPTDSIIKTVIPGRLEPYLQAEVRARATGIILDRCYQEGQQVKEGDVLFKIDPVPLQTIVNVCKADLAMSEAILKDANDKVEKYSTLVKSGGVSKREYNIALAEQEQSHAAIKAAQSKLEQAELELDYAVVTAPISGHIRRALVTKGALANKNELTHLTNIEQIDPIYVRFSAPSNDLTHLRRSIASGEYEQIPYDQMKVRIVLPDGREYPIEGKILFSDRSVDPQTDTVEMRAIFKNPDHELLPGAYVRIHFDTAKQKNIFRIPRDAVTRTAQGAMVFTVSKENTLEIRPIQTQRLDGRDWIVTDGLQAGDRVIISRIPRPMPGIPVTIVAPTPDTTAPEANITTQPTPEATPKQKEESTETSAPTKTSTTK